MRNERLHGYLIHHRKYREKSHIVHLFTQEYGRIDGVLRQTPPPQFQPIQTLASGKTALKNFTQLEIQHQPIFFHGDAFFCGFYLNELILRLCPIEEQMPAIFKQYTYVLEQLQFLNQQNDPNIFLKQLLRQFEHVLLSELGYLPDYSIDSFQKPIEPQKFYQFYLEEGFVPTSLNSKTTLQGEQLLSLKHHIAGTAFNTLQLQCLSRLYRQMITALLGDRPLKSRQLWVQHRQVKT